MTRHLPRPLALALVLFVAAVTGQASSSRFWLASTQADLLKGEADQLSIDEFGRLVLGPSVRTVHNASGPFVWCLAPGPDGVVYAGTGNEGQVLRLDRQGAATVWFDAAELEVHAMVAAPDGMLYVGTSPDGRVYRVDRAGKASVFFDPEDKYIWSLALDRDGRVYVGTGEKGQIYRIEPGGAATPFHKTTSTHVTALAIDRQGRLVAGTDSPGRVVRIAPDGKGFVLLDSPYREVRAIRLDQAGRIYAAVVNGKPPADAAGPSTLLPGEPARPAAVASVSSEIMAVTIIDTSVATSGSSQPPARETGATPKGAVIRIEDDGSSETIWESRDDIPFDVSLDGPDGVLVATGNGGKVFRVAGMPSRATLVTRVAAQQATAFLQVGDVRYVATSNPGRLVVVGAARAAQGSYVSEVKDAGTVATWGTVSWRHVNGRAGQVQVFTRSGNTTVTEEGWSPWAGPYERADGEPVRSPAARYLQWKVVMAPGAAAEPPPALASLSIAYLQRNLRPRVTEVTVHPPGVVFQKPYPTGEPEIAGLENTLPENRFPVFSMPLGLPTTRGSGPALGRRMYQKGLQAFIWKAEDGNDDRLTYNLHFRRAGETAWLPLREGSLDELLVWDTTSVPDGSYVIRVTASDRLSNVPPSALAGEAQSQAFDIDNTPPAVTIATVTADGPRSVVTCDIQDGHSVIERVEYTIDAGPWQAVFPVDGAADARRERFEITVPGPVAGRMVIRATDAMNNTGTAKVEPPQPSPSSELSNRK